MPSTAVFSVLLCNLYRLYQILLHHIHALAAVNTPIRGWKVYQTHCEYRMLMVEGNLVVTYLIMLLAMLIDHRFPGQMMLKAVKIFHYCVLQSERSYIIITHYIIKPPCVHFDMAYISRVSRIGILCNRC